MPAWPLRLALGEMSELLLCGQQVVLAVALRSAYRFRHASLNSALAQLTGRAPREGALARKQLDTMES